MAGKIRSRTTDGRTDDRLVRARSYLQPAREMTRAILFLDAVCGNCGFEFVVEIKGGPRHDECFAVVCPRCGRLTRC
jgi:hypothetical protein